MRIVPVTISVNDDRTATVMHATANRATDPSRSAGVDGRRLDMTSVEVHRYDSAGRVAETWIFPGDQEAQDAFWA